MSSRLTALLIAIAAANAFLTSIVVLLPSTIFSPNEYANWRSVHGFRASGRISLVLGDSRARAGVRVPLLGEDWRNLALGGSTPVEVKLLYDNHVGRWGALDAVVLGFAGFHLEFPDSFERRTLQYDQLSIAQILALRARAGSPDFRESGGVAFLDASDSWLGYKTRLWPFYAAEIREGWVDNALREPLHPLLVMHAQYKALLAEYERSAGWEARHGSIAELPERRFPSDEGSAEFRPNRLIEAYLDELVADVATRARLVVLTSPPHSTLTAANPSSQAYWSAVAAALCAIAAEHDNVVVMPIATFDERYFNDPSHLNVDGARLWTAEIASFLQTPADACGAAG